MDRGRALNGIGHLMILGCDFTYAVHWDHLITSYETFLRRMYL